MTSLAQPLTSTPVKPCPFKDECKLFRITACTFDSLRSTCGHFTCFLQAYCPICWQQKIVTLRTKLNWFTLGSMLESDRALAPILKKLPQEICPQCSKTLKVRCPVCDDENGELTVEIKNGQWITLSLSYQQIIKLRQKIKSLKLVKCAKCEANYQ